jgi:hypothetical protein
VAEDSKDDAQAQPKKKFFVRDIDASLLRRNAELSKNARLLHGTLRAMADARTGELRIGAHWWTPAEISRESEMCERNRKTAMRELVAAGLAHPERERRSITVKDRMSGRLRKRDVLGPAHYYVSQTPRPDWLSSTVHTQNPNNGAGSSTGKKMHRRPKPHKQRVSSTVQQGIPGNDSSTVQFLHGAKNASSILSSEAPIDLPPAALPSHLPLSSGANSPISQGGASQGSPAPTAPPRDIKPKFKYPPQTADIVAWLNDMMRAYAFEHQPIPTSKLQSVREYFLEQTNALAIPFSASIALYETVVRKFLNAEPKPQPASHPQAEDSSPEPTIERYQANNLRRHAYSHGWSKAALETYLLQFFSVRSPVRLTITEFNAAYKRTQHPPSQPN